MSLYSLAEVIDFLKKDTTRVCEWFNRSLQQRTFEHPETTVVISPWFLVVEFDSDSYIAREIFTECYSFAQDRVLGLLEKISPWAWVTRVTLEVDPEQHRARLEVEVIYE